MGLRVQNSTATIRPVVGKDLSAAESIPNEIEKPRVVKSEESRENTKQESKILLEEIEEGVDSLNSALEFINRGLEFTIHEETNRVMVKVIDLATGEVIKEIPPEELLDTVARIRDMIGLLLDEWA
ncbi:MAG: flagellar protein FlaG [Firmicutes bacterium]|nr:flagellar protein FlaG [Bacillota bacterium]